MQEGFIDMSCLIGSAKHAAGFEGGAGKHEYRGEASSRRNSTLKRNSADSKALIAMHIQAAEHVGEFFGNSNQGYQKSNSFPNSLFGNRPSASHDAGLTPSNGTQGSGAASSVR